MVKSMRPGSVIVDLAAEQGGNCELTVPGEVVVRHGVTIIGYTDLPSRLAGQASTLYANNLLRLAEELCKTKDGNINVDFDDEVIRGTTVIKEGAVTWPPPPPKPSAAPPQAKPGGGEAAGSPEGAVMPRESLYRRRVWRFSWAAAQLLFLLIGAFAPASFLQHFTVFVLACFIGYMVIWNVTPALHTPLMSVTNAISSIIAVGALIQVAPPLGGVAEVRPSGLDPRARRRGARAHGRQHARRFRRHPPHAGDVPEIRGARTCLTVSQPSPTLAPRSSSS